MKRSAMPTTMPAVLLRRRNALLASAAAGTFFLCAGVYVILHFSEMAGNDISAIVAMAVACLAPFLGLPAALMGRKDLRWIRQGIIPASLRMATWWAWILGVASTAGNTILLLVFVFQVLSIAGPDHAKVTMTAELNNLVQTARDYRSRSASTHGGSGSYSGFSLGSTASKSEDGLYAVRVLHPDTLQFMAIWRRDSSSTIVVRVGPNGKPAGGWIFGGEFRK